LECLLPPKIAGRIVGIEGREKRVRKIERNIGSQLTQNTALAPHSCKVSDSRDRCARENVLHFI